MVRLQDSTASDNGQEATEEPRPSGPWPFEPTPVIVVIGKTGSGKSSFIETLGGRHLFTRKPPPVSGSSKSCTHTATVYTTMIQNRRVYLVDTPGFDDSARDNLAILNDIVSHLWALVVPKSFFRIQGAIFLHDIGEARMGSSQQKTWEIVKALCGDGLKNVIVGTTMWSTGTPRKFKNEEEREKELQSDYWKGIHKTMRVLDGDIEGAYQIAEEVLALPPVVFLAQKEMMEPPHTTENTSAGRLAMPEGREEAEKLKREIQEAKRQMQEEVRRLEEEYQRNERARRLEEENRRNEDARQLEEENRRKEKAHQEWKEENQRKEKERQKLEEMTRKYEKKKRELENLQEEMKKAESERKSSSWCSIL